MSKKLLSEAQIRRFQSLANLPVLNEKYHKEEGMHKEGAHEMEEGRYGMEEMAHPKDKEMKEDGHEMEEGAHAKVDDEKVLDEGEHEEKEEMDMEPEMEPEAMPEGGDLDLSEEEARVIIELGKKLEGIMGAEEAGEDMPGEPDPMGDELMEALAGVDVQPSRKEVVEEVARRVARRLNEAKRAQRRLNRALGNK